MNQCRIFGGRRELRASRFFAHERPRFVHCGNCHRLTPAFRKPRFQCSRGISHNERRLERFVRHFDRWNSVRCDADRELFNEESLANIVIQGSKRNGVQFAIGNDDEILAAVEVPGRADLGGKVAVMFAIEGKSVQAAWLLAFGIIFGDDDRRIDRSRAYNR